MAQGYVSGQTTNPSVGQIVQVVNTTTGAMATGSTVLPDDNTIPQITEGDQYMTLSITPTSSSNKLIILINSYFSAATFVGMMGALFQDATAGALASYGMTLPAATQLACFYHSYYMTAGTTSSTTFRYRVGTSSAQTITFNGVSGAGKFGGTIASSITILEIKA